MFIYLKADEFKEIVEFIKNEEEIRDLKVLETNFKRGVWIQTDNEITELYIKTGLNSLIISRIGFKKQRQGLGTKVLKLLEDICNKKNISNIIIESTLTPEMNKFCIKHGFSPITSMCFKGEDGEMYGNYIKKLK